MPGEPPDVARLIAELDATDAAAAQLVGAVSELQLQWQPEGGRRWSMAQNLAHLARANEVFAASMATALERLGAGVPLREAPFG
jgi:hypothetical protein